MSYILMLTFTDIWHLSAFRRSLNSSRKKHSSITIFRYSKIPLLRSFHAIERWSETLNEKEQVWYGQAKSTKGQELHRLMRAIYVVTIKADVSRVSYFPDIIKPRF